MKTKRNVFRKMIRLSILIMAVVITQGCETEIPTTDETPPTFSFRVRGDGFDRTFNQNTNFDSFILNLRNGATYSFTLIGSDAGGVERIQWFIPTNSTSTNNLQVRLYPLPSPWDYRNTGPLESVLEWIGDRSNPLTGGAIESTFRTHRDNSSLPLRFVVADFGGRRTSPNRILKVLTVAIGNHATRIRNL